MLQRGISWSRKEVVRFHLSRRAWAFDRVDSISAIVSGWLSMKAEGNFQVHIHWSSLAKLISKSRI